MSTIKVEICQECNAQPATEAIYMDSDSFGKDYLYTCKECKVIHFALIKAEYPDKFNFMIRSTDCEINGKRDYLVDANTLLRVRLFEKTTQGVLDAVKRFCKDFELDTLYRMPIY